MGAGEWTLLIGAPVVGLGLVEVPLADVVGVRVAKVFNRSVVGNRTHLVVQTRIGEVGYFVADTEGWQAAIERATT